MRESYWKTTGKFPHRPAVQWPSLGQSLRQVGLAAVILLIWGAVFGAFLWLNDSAGETAAPGESEVPVAALAPTETATQTPSPTPTVTPTPTHTATPLPAESNTQPQESGPPPTSTPTPSPTNTSSPTPTPTLTETPPAAPSDSTAAVSFSADVLPIFERRCIKCHGRDKTEDGLRLTSHTEVLAGSWNGPVVEPGNAADSYLIEQVESGEMPKNEPRLLPAEIRTLTDWVTAGAPDN